MVNDLYLWKFVVFPLVGMVRAELIKSYFFAESEVSEFEMSICRDENIIRFYVSVNVVHLVHLLNRNYQLSDIETSFCFSEDVLFDQ